MIRRLCTVASKLLLCFNMCILSIFLKTLSLTWCVLFQLNDVFHAFYLCISIFIYACLTLSTREHCPFFSLATISLSLICWNYRRFQILHLSYWVLYYSFSTSCIIFYLTFSCSSDTEHQTHFSLLLKMNLIPVFWTTYLYLHSNQVLITLPDKSGLLSKQAGVFHDNITLIWSGWNSLRLNSKSHF